MTMSKDRRELYTAMTQKEVRAVDAAFDAANEALKQHGFKVAGDDRAENLVGAIARYLRDSNPKG